MSKPSMTGAGGAATGGGGGGVRVGFGARLAPVDTALTRIGGWFSCSRSFARALRPVTEDVRLLRTGTGRSGTSNVGACVRSRKESRGSEATTGVVICGEEERERGLGIAIEELIV